MAPPGRSFARVVAPVLAVGFALAAIALVLTARPQLPPTLSQIPVVEGRVREPAAGFVGATLRVATSQHERTIDAGGCAKGAAALVPGDPVTAWVDRDGRAWRLMRGSTVLCTYLQAMAADESARRTRRASALVLAVAGVVCGGMAVRGRLRRG
jgi:hypothetical protein